MGLAAGGGIGWVSPLSKSQAVAGIAILGGIGCGLETPEAGSGAIGAVGGSSALRMGSFLDTWEDEESGDSGTTIFRAAGAGLCVAGREEEATPQRNFAPHFGHVLSKGVISWPHLGHDFLKFMVLPWLGCLGSTS